MDSEYDGRSSLSDQDDIASIFSADSLPSSQYSLSEDLSVAIYEFANLLPTDAELMLLYPTAITKVGLDKFQRNFARFLKRYGQSPEAEASNEIQCQAAQFVRRPARRIVVEMGRELKHDDEDFHELRGLDIEVPKLTQVNKWLELRKRMITENSTLKFWTGPKITTSPMKAIRMGRKALGLLFVPSRK